MTESELRIAASDNARLCLRGKPATESGAGLGETVGCEGGRSRVVITVHEHRSQGGQATGSTTEEPPEETPAE
jgi:hypothetical protein